MGDRLINLVAALGSKPEKYEDGWTSQLMNKPGEGVHVDKATRFARFIAELGTSPAKRREWEDDPETAAANAGLTDSQTEALQKGDAKAIERELSPVSDPGDPTVRGGNL